MGILKKRKNFFAVKNLKTFCLVLATFFNPLGFDILFKAVMSVTKSYWITDSIFYFISIVFFVIYFKLSKKEIKKD